MEKRTVTLFDPRAHAAPEDSELWALLMSWAIGEELIRWPEMVTPDIFTNSLYSAIHGLRCGMARIEVEGRIARIVPGLWSAEDYEDLRQRFLVPHAALLRKLLIQLGAWAYERSQARRDWADIKQEAML